MCLGSGTIPPSRPFDTSTAKLGTQPPNFKTEYKYIHFIKYFDSGKTTKWHINNNRTKAILGLIAWSAAWRRYVFITVFNIDCEFDEFCLEDIQDFIRQLMKART